MPFRFSRQARTTTVALVLTSLFAFSGCNRAAREKKDLRNEVGVALSEHSYGKASELARRLVKLDPQDNGSWDRLVQSLFGSRDFAATKQALEEWRGAT